MSEVVTIRLADEHVKMLDEMAERDGYRSRGQAAKAIVEERLCAKAQADALEPLVERIEQRLARTASRGTKASIASLCLLSAWGDEAMSAKLDAMPAGRAFDFAWDMAGALMAHGSRPDFYKAAKSSALLRKGDEKRDAELVRCAFSFGEERLAEAVDDEMAEAWAEHAARYLETRGLIEGAGALSSEAQLGAWPAYAHSVGELARMLSEMLVFGPGDAEELLGDESLVFSREGSWHVPDAAERARRESRGRG